MRFSKRNIIEYILVAVSGILYIFQCSSWTSPLYPYAYGYDSSWYSLMGRAITEGCVPYRDYFDLKGPVFFFYEALGQLIIRNRPGIFLIQCISVVFTVVILWITAGLFLNRFLSAALLLLYYFVAYALIWGGNTVEELFLPFSFAAVYLTLDHIKNGEKAFFSKETAALIMGIGFGICLYSKVTIAAVIISSVITVLITLIREKDYEAIKGCAAGFLKGLMIVTVPVFIYFIVNGAVKDFLYCAFLFAFRRSTDYYEPFSFEWERNLLICYAAVFYGICMKPLEKEEKDRRMYLLILAVIQFLSLHFGTPYLYYFLTQMPVFAVMLIYILKDDLSRITNDIKLSGSVFRPDIRYFAIFLAITTTIIGYWDLNVDKIKENIMIFNEETGKSQVLACREIYELVPEWERDDIYNLESGMIYYEVNQVLPPNKYPVNLPYFLHLDPRIKTDVMNKLRFETPKWIICERMWEFDDEDIKDYVYSNYELVADNEGEELYRLFE